VLLAGATILLVFLAFIIYRGFQTPIESRAVSSPAPYFKEEHYESIRGRTYANERVVLDGRDFQACVFINATFVYNGTAGFAFSHNTLEGSYIVVTGAQNRAGSYTVAMLKGLGMIRGPILDDEDKKPLQNIQAPEVR
jgi:hypothetical protein